MGRTGIRFRVKDVDKGWKKIRELAKKVGDGKTYVKVGIIGPEALEQRDSGISTVGLALVHEFGAPEIGIPERSFLRATFDKNRNAYKLLLRKLLRQVFAKKPSLTEIQALGLLGSRMASDVKAFVTRGAQVPPPNAPETLARKRALTRKGSRGKVRTLVDTGRMIGSITWIVVQRGREKGKG